MPVWFLKTGIPGTWSWGMKDRAAGFHYAKSEEIDNSTLPQLFCQKGPGCQDVSEQNENEPKRKELTIIFYDNCRQTM